MCVAMRHTNENTLYSRIVTRQNYFVLTSSCASHGHACILLLRTRLYGLIHTETSAPWCFITKLYVCRYNDVGPVFVWWIIHYPLVVVTDSECLKVSKL